MRISHLPGALLLILFLLMACYGLAQDSPALSYDEIAPVLALAASPLAPEDHTSGHPRLFFTQGEIGSLQVKATSTHLEVWTPIQAYVVSQLGTTPPGSTPENSDLDTFRNHGNQLIPFAFACVITNRTDICSLAKQYLLAYASWEAWSIDGERDLALAHMAQGSAIAYDWLYNQLSDDEREIVRESLARRAQQLYEASIGDRVPEWNNWWTDSYMQNHYFTNHSALGIAGLVLLNEDPRAEKWVERARERMSRAQYLLDGIGDGSWHESLGYQGYALTLSLPFLFNLREIEGVDLFPHVYLRNYPYWRIYNHLPNSTQYIMAYGDFEWTWGDFQPENILRFSASEYHHEHSEWMAQQMVAVSGRHHSVWATPWYVFEFLYYNPAIPARAPSDLPLARTFSDLEGVIWRTGWDEDDLIFGLKTGAYGGRFAFETFTQGVYPWESPCADTGCQLNIGHDHDDTNSFYLAKGGQWLATESEGAGKYGTSFHNTLLIDGQGQYRPPADRFNRYPEDFIDSDGFLEATANTPNFNYVAADATRRYKQILDLQDFTRHVLFVQPHYFLMVDHVAAMEAHLYQWIIHFDESVSVEGDWIRGNSSSEQTLGIGILAPTAFTVETGSDGQPFASLEPSTPVPGLRFANLLYPTSGASWEQRPEASVVIDNGKMLLARIISQDGSQQQDDVLLSYSTATPTATLEDYVFNGRVAVIQHVESKVKKVFFYDGTLLRDEETEIDWIVSPAGSGTLEITYGANTMFIDGQLMSNLTLYAPGVTKLLVNGAPWLYTRSGDYITVEVKASFLPSVSRDAPGHRDTSLD